MPLLHRLATAALAAAALAGTGAGTAQAATKVTPDVTGVQRVLAVGCRFADTTSPDILNFSNDGINSILSRTHDYFDALSNHRVDFEGEFAGWHDLPEELRRLRRRRRRRHQGLPGRGDRHPRQARRVRQRLPGHRPAVQPRPRLLERDGRRRRARRPVDAAAVRRRHGRRLDQRGAVGARARPRLRPAALDVPDPRGRQPVQRLPGRDERLRALLAGALELPRRRRLQRHRRPPALPVLRRLRPGPGRLLRLPEAAPRLARSPTRSSPTTAAGPPTRCPRRPTTPTTSRPWRRSSCSRSSSRAPPPTTRSSTGAATTTAPPATRPPPAADGTRTTRASAATGSPSTAWSRTSTRRTRTTWATPTSRRSWPRASPTRTTTASPSAWTPSTRTPTSTPP